MFKNIEERKNCPMRHECGNCLPAGGFCASDVPDELCHALHNAYSQGSCDMRLLTQIQNATSEEILKTIKNAITLHERMIDERPSFAANEFVKNVPESETQQEIPRLYTKDELRNEVAVVFMEFRGKGVYPGIVDRERTNDRNLWVVYKIEDYGKTPWEEYEAEWRCWNANPTEKQRKAKPWNHAV